MPTALAGQCACGSSIWESSSNAQHLDCCYCKLCQQISGSPFVAWMGIPKDALTWNRALQNVVVNELATRGYCSECGSTMTIQYHCYPSKTHVAAGSVVVGEDHLPKVGTHIWISRKPAWYSIPDDGVERWEEFDPEFEAVLARFKQGGSAGVENST